MNKILVPLFSAIFPFMLMVVTVSTASAQTTIQRSVSSSDAAYGTSNDPNHIGSNLFVIRYTLNGVTRTEVRGKVEMFDPETNIFSVKFVEGEIPNSHLTLGPGTPTKSMTLNTATSSRLKAWGHSFKCVPDEEGNTCATLIWIDPFDTPYSGYISAVYTKTGKQQVFHDNYKLPIDSTTTFHINGGSHSAPVTGYANILGEAINFAPPSQVVSSKESIITITKTER
jgi:hypothetical protein